MEDLSLCQVKNPGAAIVPRAVTADDLSDSGSECVQEKKPVPPPIRDLSDSGSEQQQKPPSKRKQAKGSSWPSIY